MAQGARRFQPRIDNFVQYENYVDGNLIIQVSPTEEDQGGTPVSTGTINLSTSSMAVSNATPDISGFADSDVYGTNPTINNTTGTVTTRITSSPYPNTGWNLTSTVDSEKIAERIEFNLGPDSAVTSNSGESHSGDIVLTVNAAVSTGPDSANLVSRPTSKSVTIRRRDTLDIAPYGNPINTATGAAPVKVYHSGSNQAQSITSVDGISMGVHETLNYYAQFPIDANTGEWYANISLQECPFLTGITEAGTGANVWPNIRVLYPDWIQGTQITDTNTISLTGNSQPIHDLVQSETYPTTPGANLSFIHDVFISTYSGTTGCVRESEVDLFPEIYSTPGTGDPYGGHQAHMNGANKIIAHTRFKINGETVILKTFNGIEYEIGDQGLTLQNMIADSDDVAADINNANIPGITASTFTRPGTTAVLLRLINTQGNDIIIDNADSVPVYQHPTDLTRISFWSTAAPYGSEHFPTGFKGFYSNNGYFPVTPIGDAYLKDGTGSTYTNKSILGMRAGGLTTPVKQHAVRFRLAFIL